jgi:ATP-dependent DNA ligase
LNQHVRHKSSRESRQTLHVPAKGVELFQVICREDLEGVVAKHKLAPYAATPQTWFKILNNDYSQKRGRRELFERFRERQHVPA